MLIAALAQHVEILGKLTYICVRTCSLSAATVRWRGRNAGRVVSLKAKELAAGGAVFREGGKEACLA